jgi:hypothetical protein
MMRRLMLCSPALVAGLALVALAGCDYLKGSGTSSRVSPFISGMGVSKASVLCDVDFDVSFDYSDPQNDISQMTVTFFNTGTQTTREVKVNFVDGAPLNLKTGGRAIYTTHFFCSPPDPGGTWTIKVVLDDLKGHLSNELSHDINLTAASPAP